jgi:ElaB/YqjD/DUF883 family membrane-anchored ribosome-binding protein
MENFSMPNQPVPGVKSNEASAHPENDPNLKAGLADQAKQASAALAETAQRTGNQVREAASSLGSEAQQRFQGYLDQQVVAGADLAGRIAGAIDAAADELGRTSPALGSAVRGAGERVQDLSQRFRDKTADEIVADARDLVRHKPALVFGVAAALGFVAYRVLNAGVTQGTSRERPSGGYDDWRQRPSSENSPPACTGVNPGASVGHIHGD